MEEIEPMTDDALAELDREVENSAYVALSEYQWRALRARLDAAENERNILRAFRAREDVP